VAAGSRSNFGSRLVNNGMKRTSSEQKTSGTPLSMNTKVVQKSFRQMIGLQLLVWFMSLTKFVNDVMQLHGACGVGEYMEAK
jgi:hypothetical protein